MALVFKIKHEESLRRWVVSESADSRSFSVTLGQLEAKVRELFQLPPSAVLAITYVDKEEDIVTLGNDHDLIDACLVQCLNPLRLEVQVLESDTADQTPRESSDTFSLETFLKSLFPQATTEAVQGFLHRCPQLLDPRVPVATLIAQAQDAFNDLLVRGEGPNYHKPGAPDKHHPYRHPFVGMHSKSFPHRGDRSAAEDASSSYTFHVGVQCDGCGMTPIQGIRYKSNKTTDFDLCSSCFEEKGGVSEDYEKLEHPGFGNGHPFGPYRPPYLRRGVRPPFVAPPFCGRGSFARGPYGWKQESGFGGRPFNFHEQHKKLDARFVKDVTIFDGTEVAPGTKFTKIWRMSNVGSLPWPHNTQLLHIGGDVLSSQEAVNLELSENGLACGEEVEVSVDLTAPEQAGRYTSHWRLVSSSGQKFGQRVWTTIQVVPQGEQSPMLQESMKAEAGNEGGVTEAFAKPMHVVALEDAVKKNHAESNDEMMATDGVAGLRTHEGAALAECKVDEHDINQETEGFALVEKPSDSVMEETMDNVDNISTEKSSHELQLESLESMGFTNREVNSFLLNKNQENMQRTLDDLLVAAGWDGSLRDLQEMGFMDQSANVRLLSKHKGNIKAVVKDLVHKGKQKA